MALPDLTGQNIENTYQRIVQTDGTNFYDGTGSLVNIGGTTFPYTGSAIITGSLVLTGSAYISEGLATQYIDFDIDTTSPFQEGRIQWIGDTKTLAIDTDVNNFSIEVGHQTVIRGRNETGFDFPTGTVVYLIGGNNNRPLFSTASWENDANSAFTIGIVAQPINNNNNGYAITNGIIRDINTSAFTSGDALYLSSSGHITNIPPVAPLHNVRLGKVISATNNGLIHVDIDNGYELGELHNVLNTGSKPGDLLIVSNSLWINSKQLTGSYGLTGSLTATSFTGSLSGTASWANNATTASYVNIFPYTGSAVISGGLDVDGPTNIEGNLIISGASSQIILISESAQNANCLIYNGGDSLFLYAALGSGKEINMGSNLRIFDPSNTSVLNGYFSFNSPPNDNRPHVTIARRNNSAYPGLVITNRTPTAPSIRTETGIQITGSSLFTGSLNVIGSLILTGSFIAQLPTSSTETYFITYNTASFQLEAREVATLINPKVEYLNLTASISSGTSLTLPNGLSYISSSVYEYLEVFFNGLRLRYNRDFIPTSTTTIQTQLAFPSGSELTFKSLKS
jgi:hypothetical protein